MEKFAIDLDKVLDDFEFNEDCAEQIACVSCSTNSAVTTSGPSFSKSYSLPIVEPFKTNKGFESTLSFDKHKDSQHLSIHRQESLAEKNAEVESDDYYEAEDIPEDVDSEKEFYTHDSATDSKISQKQGVQIQESKPVNLTIYNDISQKVLQKQQNGNGGPKIQNTYDKKLNQPNIKPSVSNVFSSLNEYINAPTVSVNSIDTVLDKQDCRPNNLSELPRAEIDREHAEDASINSSKIIKDLVTDRNGSIPKEETGLPEYQNIAISCPLESTTSSNATIKEKEKVDNVFPTKFVSVNSEEQAEKVERPANTSTASSVQIYENLPVIKNVPEAEELHSMVDNSDKISHDLQISSINKHTYENVDLNEPKYTIQPENAEHVYENVCAGKDEKPSGASGVTEISEIKETSKTYVQPDTRKSEAESKVSYKFPLQQIQDFQPDVTLLPSVSGKHDGARPKPIGFSNIDDLSEEELNRYLAELEAEEKLKEENVSYQNVPLSEHCKETKASALQNTFQHNPDDEDANEAPIFENVMIGELPQVSEEELQEKAKKFPVIDYNRSMNGDEKVSDFLEKPSWEKFPDASSADYVEREDPISEKNCRPESEILSDKTTDTKVDRNYTVVQSESEELVQSPLLSDNEKIVNDVKVPVESLEKHNECTNDSNASRESVQKSDEPTAVLNSFEESTQSVDTVVAETHDDTSVPNCVQSDQPNEIQADPGTDSSKEDISADDESKTNPTLYTEDHQQAIDSSKGSVENVKDIDKPTRPRALFIIAQNNTDQQKAPDATPSIQEQESSSTGVEDSGQEPSPDTSDNSLMESNIILGKQPPFWIPDSDAPSCMLCEVKFTVLKRRHHCRACGKVLCHKCCNMKFRLEYQGNIDSRVCVPCYQLLVKAESDQGMGDWSSGYTNNPSSSDINSPQGRQPNPNNPMEYCSTIPPLQQLAGGLPPPPTVMVPVGVLKRDRSTKQRPEGSKSVMFSDGIRPGCDLTELDTSWDLKTPYCKSGSKRMTATGSHLEGKTTKRQNHPPLDPVTNSYIPQDPNLLPPTVTIHKGQVSYHNVTDQDLLYKTLKNDCEPPVMFAINRNLYAYVKITNLNCCVNKTCWNVTSRGLACLGQDEVILLLETFPDETRIPKDLLIYINQIYCRVLQGDTFTELDLMLYMSKNGWATPMFGHRANVGFLFIRQTLQCLQKIILPPAPFLIGLLVLWWEVPWAKLFPLRFLLRLGAEYRYYPCPLVSTRLREAVYCDVGHTVMKVLADFRTFGYTLPGVRGLTIHLKNRTTDVMFPRNRYDQVIKGLNNSNDHVLAYAANFSITADAHLVCIQTKTGDEINYQTQAINIHNKPRTVTGASFIIINGALKSSMGLSAKSSIVEDGLMVEIMPEKMEALKAALKNMQDFSIGCGRQGAPEPDETVNIKWVENDTQFNLGVKSPIDGQLMDGIPSIRVHNGIDYKGTSRIIRWTEVFIIKSDDHPNSVHDPVDINKFSESIARASCTALVKLLDLLATAGLTKLAVRATIHPDNVGYEAGSEGTKLPPIYMNSLDNELIQVLHKAAQSSQDTHTVLELIFYILDD